MSESLVVPQSSPLPVFERPPVAEVAIGVFFEPALSLTAPHIGKLHDRWKADYPQLHEWAVAAPPVIDTPPNDLRSGLIIEWVQKSQLPRHAFVSSDDERVIQVQHDRLVHNWRREAAEYPHYSALLPLFTAALQGLAETLEEDSDALPLSAFEVTYINPIAVGGPYRQARSIGDVLTFWPTTEVPVWLAEPELLASNLRVGIDSPDGARLGTLTASATSARDAGSGDEVLLLTLVANGLLVDRTKTALLRSLDLAHESIVRAFAATTTPAMHDHWGRTR